MRTYIDNIKKNQLKKLYPYDEKNNRFIINISVKKLEDVFNKWDSSVFEKKDISVGLKNYLEECSQDIPFKFPIVLRLNIFKGKISEKRKKTVEEGIKYYFSLYRHTLLRSQNKMRKKLVGYVLKSFVLLFIAIFFEHFGDDVFSRIFLTGLTVGGWVFLWEALSLEFFHNDDIAEKLKIYKRLLDSDIEFVYKPKNKNHNEVD